MNFKDHFSKHSDLYAQARPGYPDELFHYLASLTPARSLAWDCGTGNGQAAVSLSSCFKKVIATDASEAQIKNAKPGEGIEYKVAPSENSGIESGTVDLVTAAAAVHWFDHEKFYAEVKRVLKPAGIIAVWTYTHTEVNKEVDEVVTELEWEFLKNYWPSETQFVMKRYETLPFPFEPIASPPFKSITQWNLHRLCAYLESWSATQRYIKAHGENPVIKILPSLQKAWGDPADVKTVSWELAMRLGRR